MTARVLSVITRHIKNRPLAEFIFFGYQEARACVFAGLFFMLLFLSQYIGIPGIARYDFIFIGALLIQALLIITKIETWSEARTIFLFHIIGLVLEIFKTHPAIGSWSYPEPSFFKIATVPLFSGFMYAAIGSFISQIWRIQQVTLTRYPPLIYSAALSVLIYVNFFTHHIIWDFRWILAILVIIVFSQTRAHYTVINRHSMPLPLVFGLIAFFIWIAENISTYLGAWKYPDQIHEWTLVSLSKISSWSLLVIISFIIVANLKHLEQRKKHNHLS